MRRGRCLETSGAHTLSIRLGTKAISGNDTSESPRCFLIHLVQQRVEEAKGGATRLKSTSIEKANNSCKVRKYSAKRSHMIVNNRAYYRPPQTGAEAEVPSSPLSVPFIAMT